MKFSKTLWILASFLIIQACNQPKETEEKPMRPDAPVAQKADTLLQEHGQTRIDPYFWMRLTDEQKNAETPDEHTQQVLDYLNAENDYTSKVMSHTESLQEKLYDEIIGLIKQTDE